MPSKEKHGHPLDFRTIVTLILSAAILTGCGFLFLCNYKAAYNDDAGAGYFSPADAVVFYHVCIAAAAILVSVILKLLWRRRLSLWLLLALSVCLPILSYQVNYHTLEKDGMLYFLVEEGGALHFMTINDFNFDGVDDSLDYTGDDLREHHGSSLSGKDPHNVVEKLEYTVAGKGGNLDYAYCEARFGSGQIRVNNLHKSRVTYECITVTLRLEEGVDPHSLALSMFGSPVDATVVDEHTVSVTFDADTCAAWQQSSLEESFSVTLRYAVED
jgi:hypothetical protein